eukprot:CAMPEP_0177655426 /NCGR_PEP_ID=MMETSP0447-20121125/14963_1 /TAXON_ID=0 /ORGANISM="Stygamoeba regulata, Strain BSH-02190019" /LENGTH=447 /DNA_ID=CAMNT_0019159349 /DNA_START=61 /DNA_END=1404 /DNA_ORIENTATION=-
MDLLFSRIQELSASRNPSDELELSKLLKTNDKNLATTEIVQNALGILTPETHTSAYLWFLARQGEKPAHQAVFIANSNRVMDVVPGHQLARSPKLFCRVCHLYAKFYIDQQKPICAIRPLQRAISLVQPSPAHLTPIHRLLFKAILLSRCYHVGRQILSVDIYKLDRKRTDVSVQDFLEFCYQSGMIYIGSKDYQKALQQFRLAFTIPCYSVSAISVEIYKKYCLVSLLAHDKLVPLPSFAMQTGRDLSHRCVAYTEICSAYALSNTVKIETVAGTYADTFESDHNFGLVKQCITACLRKNIRQHTQTFLTLSVADIATNVGLASVKDAEKHVFQMIESGQVHASISQREGMVSFLDDPESYDNNASIRRLDQEIRRINALSLKVRDLDQQISSSEQYLKKVGGGSSGGVASSSSSSSSSLADPSAWPSSDMEVADSDQHLGRLLSY